MANLNGKIAIVTGGASGIGLATVKAFAEKGAKVVLADFNELAGKAKEEELKSEGFEVLFVQVDAGNEDSVKNLVAITVEKYGKLDIIVNNAGIGALGEMHELTYEEYQRVIRVNQDGVFFGTKYAVQEFLKTGGGVVLNTSSILGLVAEAGAYPYVASKHAVVGMTKSSALQYASRNIRVNAVSPGYIESGMVNKEALGEFYNGLVSRHPIGRLGDPSEIAHAFVFLAENDFVTGTVIAVDGGYTAQ